MATSFVQLTSTLQHPHLDCEILSPTLRQSATALGNLLEKCTTTVVRSDELLTRLHEHARRIGDCYEDLSALCDNAGLKAARATRATDNFAWNVRLLRSQIELAERARDDAQQTLRQVADVACSLNILQPPCEQPCTHRAT